VCVREVALSRGVDPAAAASLASLCRALLGGRVLDKSQQKSNWGRRPLTSAQIHYAALDALAPAMLARRLLASHPAAAAAGGDGAAGADAALDVAAAAQPWVRVERLAGSLRVPALAPRTTLDVRAALLAAHEASGGGGGGGGGDGGSGGGGSDAGVLGPGGLRLEEWDEPQEDDAHGGGERERTAVVPPGVTLCKSLGVIASGPGASTRLVVCVLEAGAYTRPLFGST